MVDPLPPLSAFSIVKNAERYDFPIQVALRSVLPLCEELVVDVGRSDDGTLDLVRGIDDPRLRVIERDWGEEVGRTTIVHSEETNLTLDACRHDWALYIQADEVLHEDDHPAIREALRRAAGRGGIEGLVFDYLHFYGSPEWLMTGRRAFRREIRVVRRSSGIRSMSGAQGFLVDGRRPRALHSGARVFHYGWAKTRRALIEKKKLAARYAGLDDEGVDTYAFERPPGLSRFTGTHPAVARPWIDGHEWPFDPDDAEPVRLDRRELKRRMSDAIERLTGRRFFEHRNYELVE